MLPMPTLHRNLDKVEWAQTSSVVAARYSKAELESSFIVNDKRNASSEWRRGAGGAQTWPMPASQYPSEQIVKNSKVWAIANHFVTA